MVTPPSGGGLSGNISGATSGADSNVTFGATDGGAVGLDGDDIITVSNSNLQAQLTAGGFIHGGAGIDTLKLAAGTNLSLASLTNNQTVRPIQEIEVFTMQGSSSVLSMTANDVLSMGGAVSTMGPTYTFGSTAQGGGATGSTSSTGKVQVVVHGQTGDTLNLQALANDAVTGTGANAGIFGNTGLAGSWAYKGTVVLNDAQGTQHTYKVYDHSTTGAQVLADVNVTVNTLSPITIDSITTDAGPNSTDFVTNDPTLLYAGTVPVLASGEKVHVKIVNPSTLAVVYEGDAVLNGTNWTLDKTAATLADGSYVIQAQIVDSSGNAVSSYGALGSATHALTVDTGTPTIAVTQSGTGNTRTVTFTLSEASTTFDASDVDVTNGTLTNFAPDTSTLGSNGGYTRYTATFTAPNYFSGTATVGVLNSKFTDMAGNANADTYVSGTGYQADNQVSFAVDTVPPTVAISSDQLYLNSTTSTATITFTFSEAVVQGSATNQFDLSDVVYSGGTLTGLTPVAGTGDATNGYTQYTATFTATANSTTDGFIGIQNGKFADATGNLNQDTYVAGVSGAVQEADNALNLPINTSSTIEIFNVNGSGPNYTQSGFDLRSVGDMNGDGKEDFLIATRGRPNPYRDSASEIDSKAYIVFGADSLNIDGLNLSSLETAGNGKGFVVNGGFTNGYSAQTDGMGTYDYNGDGLMDLVINNGTDRTSYVVYGKTNTNPVSLSTAFQASDGFTITSPSYSTFATPIGDINGDGYVDTFIDGPNFVLYGSSNPGNITLPSGSTGSSTMGFFIKTTDNVNRGIAEDVVGGDFNGDGYNDLAVYDYTFNSTGGNINIIYGGPTYLSQLATNAGVVGSAGTGFQITGLERIDQQITGSRMGDVNGDGLADLIINDQTGLGTAGYTDNSVYVVFGRTATGSIARTALTAASNTEGFRIYDSRYTYGVGSADLVGDFNGDGLQDILVSRAQGNASMLGANSYAYLIYGKTDGTPVDIANLTASQGFKVMNASLDPYYDQNSGVAASNSTTFGRQISAAGDLNGDGFADLIMSDYIADTSSGTNRDAGVTYVVYGGQFPSGSPTVFTVAGGDKLGTSGADTLVGTSGNNQMVAGAGDDTLTGNGGADVLYGGAGNDTFVLNASNVAAFANASNTTQAVMKVDGGTGIDTLKLDGSGITLDLTAITKADLGNVEIFDISGSGANTLKLNMRDVLELGQRNTFNVDASAVDSKVQLMITGDNGDFVQLTDIANWSQPLTNSTYSFGGHTYNVYNNAGAQLLIDQLIVQAGHLSA